VRPRLLLASALLAAAPALADETAPREPRPKIAFDRDVHDFGVVRQEQELRTELTVRNDGDATLHLRNVRADCGCAVAATDVREVAPGSSAPIRVVFRTMTFSGPLTKRVRVWSDDPDRPEAEVRLTMDVSAGIVLVPSRLAFGEVLAGTSPEASVTARWKEGVGRPFRVTGVESKGLDLVFETKPFEAPPWRGTTVVARFRSPPPVGTSSGMVYVRTDDPDVPRLMVGASASVSGPVWLSLRRVRLGIVAEGRERAVPVTVRAFSSDVDLGEVKAVARGGRVEAKAVRTAGRPSEWTVLVGVPAGAKPGSLDDVVEIRTAAAGEPVTELPVTGEVVGRGSR
jgi:hypothetical protein